METPRGREAMVTLSPAPVMRVEDPEGRSTVLRTPLETCRSSRARRLERSERRVLKVVVSRCSKASFVGANSVIGPDCDKVSTKSAAFIAETSVEKLGLNMSRSRIEHMTPHAPFGASPNTPLDGNGFAVTPAAAAAAAAPFGESAAAAAVALATS